MIPLSKPVVGDEEIAAAVQVLRSGHLAQGKEVEAFEAEFAAMVSVGAPYPVESVAVSNGTTALQAALMALGIGPGDEVLVPAFTFVATAGAVRAAGAQPIFVDVEPDTGNIDVAQIGSACGPRTAAVIAVHLYGMPAKVNALADEAARLGLALVEDASQAHGAAVDGRQVGSFGVGCFSFYATKNMTTGEGGMITTSDHILADKLRLLRNHGMSERYKYTMFGLNFRMTDLAAAIGRAQLRKLPEWNEARRLNAAWLDGHLRGVAIPPHVPGVEHVYHQYTVRTEHRSALMAQLEQFGVGYGIYYPEPLHRVTPYRADLTLPAAERLASECISIPVRPNLTVEELRSVADAASQ